MWCGCSCKHLFGYRETQVQVSDPECNGVPDGNDTMSDEHSEHEMVDPQGKMSCFLSIHSGPLRERRPFRRLRRGREGSTGQDRATKKPKATEDLADEEDARDGDSAQPRHPNGDTTHTHIRTREMCTCV